MLDHGRVLRDEAEQMRGNADGPTRRAIGWLLSAAMTVSVVLLAWHFHV